MSQDMAEKSASPAVRRPDPFPRLMDWFENLVPVETGWRVSEHHSIKVEELMRDGMFVVRAEMPGVDPDKDIDVTVADGVLTIRGERREEHEEGRRSEFFYGSFVRSLTLPAGIEDTAVKAEYKDGILEVRVPMPEPQTAPTQVPIARAEKEEKA
jgi:HSP20 family protein